VVRKATPEGLQHERDPGAEARDQPNLFSSQPGGLKVQRRERLEKPERRGDEKDEGNEGKAVPGGYRQRTHRRLKTISTPRVQHGYLPDVSDFATTWTLSRSRFDDVVAGLTAAQLNWKIHPHALSIGQMAVHVAGVEVSFVSQLLGRTVEGFADRVRLASTDGAVNDKPFPFEDSELTPELVAEALALGRSLVLEVLPEAREELRVKELVSALGPVITGDGAFARLGFHPGYHHGQAYLIRKSPDFPA